MRSMAKQHKWAATSHFLNVVETVVHTFACADAALRRIVICHPFSTRGRARLPQEMALFVSMATHLLHIGR